MGRTEDTVNALRVFAAAANEDQLVEEDSTMRALRHAVMMVNELKATPQVWGRVMKRLFDVDPNALIHVCNHKELTSNWYRVIRNRLEKDYPEVQWDDDQESFEMPQENFNFDRDDEHKEEENKGGNSEMEHDSDHEVAARVQSQKKLKNRRSRRS